ncbi:HNH endonuclease [Chromobacterium vaccinii]|uniref:HNH endonuclease n=1 Tax=Chromobacterium vaccinii TaxID=1108595 RepID=UPI0009E6248A|nr:hypothetical protein [Chromobacterium vaccinii]
MFNVTRTAPAPASLSKSNGYSGDDVLTQLRKIFHDKCYICEIKDPTSINVEHFHPHKGDVLKKHDWNNLFYVCGRCNNIKLAKYENLLDCTDPTVDVFKALRHIPPHTPYQKTLHIEATNNDPKTQETARLLNEVFNTDSTINKKITGSYLRKKVFHRYNRFLELVNHYYDEELPQETRDDALVRLKVLISKTQEFSAFIRWIAAEDENLNKILAEHFD